MKLRNSPRRVGGETSENHWDSPDSIALSSTMGVLFFASSSASFASAYEDEHVCP